MRTMLRRRFAVGRPASRPLEGHCLESHLTDITHVIQLAVAPVFLLTAIATLINALNIRLGRGIDRRLLICLVVAGAFVGALMAVDLSKVVAVFFILAMLAIVACLGMFLREVFLAVTGGTHRIP